MRFSLTAKSAKIALLGLCLWSPLFATLAALPYFVPGPDESYQIQGATQMAIGNGYVAAHNAEVKDLAAPALARIVEWPIAYSYSLRQLIDIGLTPLEAAKAFQLFALVLALAAWAWLLAKLQLSLWLCAGFLPLVFTQFLAWGIYSTNALSWALFPLLFGLGLEACRKPSQALAASCVCAILVVFRYQNLVLIPGGVLALLSTRAFPWRQRIFAAVLYGFLPSLAFLAIYSANSASSGHGTFLSTLPVRLGWEWRWVGDFLSAFFLGASARIDEIIVALAHKANIPSVAASVKYSVAGLLTAATILFFWKGGKLRAFEQPLQLWFAANLLCLLGMLFGLAVVFQIENIPIGRYYHPFFPFLLLLLLLSWRTRLEGLPEKVRLWGAGLFFALALVAVTAYSFYRAQLNFSYQARAERALQLVTEKLTPSVPIVVVADQLFPFFSAQKNLTTLIYPKALRGAEMPKASSPVLVFLVHDQANPKPQFPPLLDIVALAKRHAMELEEKDSILVAWKLFQ